MLRNAGRQAIALLTIALAVSSAQAASIRYDLRAVQDGTIGATVRNPKNVHVSSPNGVVQMQLWAMVENANGINGDDAFFRTMASFLSSRGGLQGDLTSANVAPFDAFPSEPGTQFDLDGDGDLDIGQNGLTQYGDPVTGEPGANPNNFFVPFAGYQESPPMHRRSWIDFPDSAKAAEIIDGEAFSSFLIGSLAFTFNDVNVGSGESTSIDVKPRIKTDGLKASRNMHSFFEDGQFFALPGIDPGVVTGAAVNVTTILTSAVPEPGSWLLAAISTVGLIAFRKIVRKAST
jgi:hypothetical protein